MPFSWILFCTLPDQACCTGDPQVLFPLSLHFQVPHCPLFPNLHCPPNSPCLWVLSMNRLKLSGLTYSRRLVICLGGNNPCWKENENKTYLVLCNCKNFEEYKIKYYLLSILFFCFKIKTIRYTCKVATWPIPCKSLNTRNCFCPFALLPIRLWDSL